LWGYPVWGVWWTWDPRLTTTLILGCSILSIFTFRQFTENQKSLLFGTAWLTILASINVPIVYFSVNLWRSIHQPQTFVSNTNTASSDILLAMFVSIGLFTMFSIVLVYRDVLLCKIYGEQEL
jgi:heme exporter protein C